MQKLDQRKIRQVIWALIALQIMLGLANGSTIAIGSLIAAQLGGQIAGGLGATMSTVGAAIFAIPLAKMVGTRGRVFSLSLGTVIAIVGAALAIVAAETAQFTLLLVAFVFIGASIAAGFQVRFAAADVSTVANRGRNISLVVWSTTIGAVAGPNLLPLGSETGRALGLSDYSGTYVIVLIAQVIALAIIAFGLRIPRPDGAANKGAAKPSLWASLRSFGDDFAPGTAYPIVFLAAAHFTMVALMSMTAVHMKGHGVALQIIGLTISLHILGMYGLSPVFGMLADKIGRMNTLRIGTALLIASTLLLIFVGGNQLAVIIALVALGLGWSAALVSSSAMLTDAAPDGDAPKYQGRSDLVMNIAGALGGILSGPVVTTWGMPTLAVISLVIVLAVAAYQVKRRQLPVRV